MLHAVISSPATASPATDAAVAAWHGLAGRSISRASGRVICDSDKSIVVRLHAGGAGNIIAKRAARALVLREAYVYEHLVARSGVAVPRFFGIGCDTDPSLEWLFIADVGGVAYDPSSREHAVRAARWLSSLHASLSDAPDELRERLPRHDAGTYLAQLRQARSSLERRLSGADERTEHRATFAKAIRVCDEIERRWPLIADLSRILPTTLVHGDLAPENMRIGGCGVIVFDWEKAGWGTPVVDVARVDLGTYAARVHALWRVPAADVARAASCGSLFRTLSHRWAEKAADDVDRVRHRLAHEMRAAGLAGVTPNHQHTRPPREVVP